MNKVILGLLLAVCVLGMALIMLNERLGRKNEPGILTTLESNVTEHRGSVLPDPAPGRSLPESPELPNQALPAAQATGAQDSRTPPAPRLDVPREAESGQGIPALPAPGQPALAFRENAAAQQASSAELKPVQTAAAQTQTAKPQGVQDRDRPVPEAPKKGRSKAAPAEPEITKTVVFVRDNGATVRLTGNGAIRYKSMTLENPSRVVVDLDGQWQIKAPGVPKNAIVSNVRIGKLPDKTRIVIDLKQAPRQTRVILSKERDSLDVRIDK